MTTKRILFKTLTLVIALIAVSNGYCQQKDSKLDSALIDADNIIKTSTHDSFKNFESFIVYADGKIVFEKYYNGAHPDSLHRIQSQTKSIISVLLGIAIDKGFIKSENEKVSTYFPDYFSIKDPLKSEVTIRDLITMSAGFEWEEMTPMNDPENDNVNMYRSMKWLKYAISRPMAGKPFTGFKYNSGCPMIVAAIIEKSAGMKLDKFADKYLFEPLGISTYRWQKDSTGFFHAGGGLAMKPSDILKIGIMIISNGRWENSRIVSEDWINRSVQPYFVTTFGNQSYGYFWWMKEMKINESKTTKVISAQGAGGQYMYLLPEYGIIVSFTERNYGTPLVCPWILDNCILTALK